MEKLKRLSGLDISSLCGMICEFQDEDIEKIIQKLSKTLNEKRDPMMRNWVRRLNES